MSHLLLSQLSLSLMTHPLPNRSPILPSVNLPQTSNMLKKTVSKLLRHSQNKPSIPKIVITPPTPERKRKVPKKHRGYEKKSTATKQVSLSSMNKPALHQTLSTPSTSNKNPSPKKLRLTFKDSVNSDSTKPNGNCNGVDRHEGVRTVVLAKTKKGYGFVLRGARGKTLPIYSMVYSSQIFKGAQYVPLIK